MFFFRFFPNFGVIVLRLPTKSSGNCVQSAFYVSRRRFRQEKRFTKKKCFPLKLFRTWAEILWAFVEETMRGCRSCILRFQRCILRITNLLKSEIYFFTYLGIWEHKCQMLVKNFSTRVFKRPSTCSGESFDKRRCCWEKHRFFKSNSDSDQKILVFLAKRWNMDVKRSFCGSKWTARYVFWKKYCFNYFRFLREENPFFWQNYSGRFFQSFILRVQGNISMKIQ